MAKFPKIYTKQDIINILKPFQPGSGTLHRKAIEDGFNEIKKKIKAEEAISSHSEFEIKFTDKHWLDDFILESLGGKRNGLKVRWKISDKTYIWDPFTGELNEY